MKEYQLEEDKGHVVSFSEFGNTEGEAVLVFHGGPGSKSRPAHAERFDLSRYRVILFDQRGCGKSTPLGKLEGNTTEDILSDAERIREKLGIERLFVAGGSWGSTLSLLYAIRHPERVKGLLLSAVFLGDRDTISWAMGDAHGAARLLPDVWARRMAFFKKFNVQLATQNADLLQAFEHADVATQKEIAAGIHDWEGNLFSVQAPVVFQNPEDVTEADIASAKIFVFYEMNHEFIEDNYILKNIGTIEHIPAVIVHGRYDILCPLEKAEMLHQRMPGSRLVVATSSGHKLTAEGETIQKMAFERFLENYA